MKAKIINVDNLPKVDQKVKIPQLKKVVSNHNQLLEQVDASQLIGYIHDYLTTRRCIIPLDDMFKRSIHFLSKYQDQKCLSMTLQTPLKPCTLKKTQSTQDSLDAFKQNKSMIQNSTEFRSHIVQKKKPNSKNSVGPLSDNQDWQNTRQLFKQTKEIENEQPQIKKVPTIEIIRKLKNIITEKDTKIVYLKDKIQQLNGSIEELKRLVYESQSKLLNQSDQLHQLNKQLQAKCQQTIQIKYPITIQQQNFPIFIQYPINLKQQRAPSIKDFYQYGQQTSQLYIDNNTLKQQIQRLQNQHQYLWMYVNKKTQQNDLF